ncbi:MULTISPECIES: [Fe-Fe] hydrogenase large subunit C-terminal domain-containing protein [Thermoanaerobacter]|uniref:Fe-S cluster domain protein n=2 Tax=Thermoanaerobacter TaxID=1754 RepID=B0KAF0_THEP3|nr:MULTISPECIES: [Fe-Fe] hydrogenase large subunit C-terminal domain-containing protein [Thermoanaerobacter]ABY95113.1 Fe-S cluster domain protein [Thermoanaerobacter pseudethanolicus ATCC 33223]ADV80064.1 Fe-S cluster domain protein [Thermoanaerobacter brockii subsp. finnii Ako-1]HBW60564.1 4Fe-4S dicluster domain-containing protein [Thermoanaerobacter sp.]
MSYFHSVTLDKDRCRGCTNCIKRCPTEAIRVRDGKARIINERCIDCGECIRVCPYHAKLAVTDSLDTMKNFKYKIALPAPSLYGQFRDLTINQILSALLDIGFDEVFEVAYAAEIVSKFTREALAKGNLKKPVISSACPAVVRFVQIKFPSLIDNLLDICSPMDTAAILAKKEAIKKTGLKQEEIGVFFISPCAAKVTSVKNPIGIEKSKIDGVFSMKEIYGLIIEKAKTTVVRDLSKASMIGVGWANSGGEAFGTFTENSIYVDGIHNVVDVLEEIELGKLNDLDFFEGLACIGGCIGGPLTVENNFVAKNRIRKLTEKLLKREEPMFDEKDIDFEEVKWKKKIEKSEVMKLDKDISKALEMMKQIDTQYKALPGLDCGSCGSPTCRALAEDIVKGYATEYDCIFILKDKIKNLSQELNELAGKIPPVLSEGKE